MGNRSKEEIVSYILEALTSPQNKTRVMFSARLSYSQLSQYMDLIAKKGLIDQKGTQWVITQKGREYLRAYMQIRETFISTTGAESLLSGIKGPTEFEPVMLSQKKNY